MKLVIVSIIVAAAVTPMSASANAAKAPLLDGIVSIDGNYALDNKGVLWAWNEDTFEAVRVLSDVKKISERNAAVKKDGSVWTWGRKTESVAAPGGGFVYFNSFDQPAPVEGLSNAVDISGQYVLKADGTVWSLGGLCEYQLPSDACAAGASVEEKRKPGRIGKLTDIVAIEGGGYFPIALAKDGTMWIWGRDKYNEPFLPSKVLDNTETNPTIFKKAASISTGMAISASWDVYLMNRYAIYGLSIPNFNLAKLAPKAAAVAGAMDDLGDFSAFSYVLMKDGSVSYWIWPNVDKKLYPLKGLSQIKAVSALSEGGGTALHKDGTVSSWARMSNYYGDDKFKYNRKIIPKKVVKGIGIRLNGNYQLVEKQPAMVNGSVLIPVRGLFESLGGTVSYANDIVTVKFGAQTIRMEVWKQEATVNGTEVELAEPVQIIRGSTMAPLRFVAESMGASVVWDAKNREVQLGL
ncbi:stalk domain-containing protein [Paenibacillus sp. FJAT-27812]|uniref:stalk domain-containing protein n=1 Tax=Paenibacillus sp. FJAT-27812 TaxID=1684143 RepID=UPI0006A79968|nr:stalk domain-containing protein [Paenibacillus sp. FJAT-27812]